MHNILISIIDICIILVMIYITVYFNKRDKLSLFNYNVYTRLLLLYIFPIFFVVINLIINVLLKNKPIVYIITSTPILISIIAIMIDYIKTINRNKMHNKYAIQVTEEVMKYFRLHNINLHSNNINIFFDKYENCIFCKVVINVSLLKVNKLDIKYDIQDILNKKFPIIEFDVLIR